MIILFNTTCKPETHKIIVFLLFSKSKGQFLASVWAFVGKEVDQNKQDENNILTYWVLQIQAEVVLGL